MSTTDIFPRTPWETFSIAAKGDAEAREAAQTLCERYRSPVLQYVLAIGVSPDDVEDLVHAFFVDFLQRDPFSSFDREKGLFRVFLCQCIRNFLYKQHRESVAQKRGGGAVHLSYESGVVDLEETTASSDDETASFVFDRYWALVVLNRVFDELESQYEKRGKGEVFAQLRPLIANHEEVPLSEVADSLGMKENAVSTALHRLRKQFRHGVEAEVEGTVADSGMVDDEIAYLKRAVARILEQQS
ncbi:MAG: sigma-70 family RNA polymerase sigma factor [Verrucomicrobiota bacterium]